MKKTTILIVLLALTLGVSAQTKQSPREEKMLTAIGHFTASLSYNTYIAIGAISDGFVKGGYTKDRVLELYKEQHTMLEAIKDRLNSLSNDTLVVRVADIIFVDKLVQLFDALQQQMSAFEPYMTDKKPESARAYDTKRQESWRRISDIMGWEN